MKGSGFVPVAALIAVLLLAGCGTPDPSRTAEIATSAQQAPPRLVWPAAPERPRIRYLRQIKRPRDLGITANPLARVFNFLKGTPPRRIRQPYGLSSDSVGRLYVVDTLLKVVHVFDPDTLSYRRFPQQAVEHFLNPIDIAVAEDGRVFVSDSEAGRVHAFVHFGTDHLRSFGAGQLTRPTGLALNRRTNELLVVDTLAGRVLVYDADTLALKRAIGSRGKHAQGFHSPTAVTVGPSGSVYVTDALNFRVQMLTPDYEFTGSFGAAGDGPGHFSRPKGIATDSDGNVYVVDALFDNVQVFDPQGRLLMDFGGPGKDPGKFWLPSAIHIDAHDRIYVADSYNQRVQVFERIKKEAAAN